MVARPTAFAVEDDGPRLEGEWTGDGPPIVLLHGLTATRRYVVMGSRVLPRSGFRVIAYDARGHGESSPAPARSAYGYADLAGDLVRVLDRAGLDRACLVGASLGAHTALRLALERPERVSALCLVTPAYTGADRSTDVDTWDALADGLEHGGIDGFLEAWSPQVGPRYRRTVLVVARQRLERHRDLGAVADAMRAVVRDRPFEGLDSLAAVEVPTLVVGSRDEADPGHPLEAAEAYAERIPRGELLVESEGSSPLAWQGAQLSRAIAAFLGRSPGAPSR